MREIKFRAWDKEYEKMFTNEILLKATGGMVEIANEELKKMDSTLCKGGLFIPTKDKNMTIMQYIGLEDKHGEEIYERDVVYIIPEDEYGIVGWDNETARYVVIFAGIVTDFDAWDGADLEVIGNIYENPDIMEGIDEF